VLGVQDANSLVWKLPAYAPLRYWQGLVLRHRQEASPCCRERRERVLDGASAAASCSTT